MNCCLRRSSLLALVCTAAMMPVSGNRAQAQFLGPAPETSKPAPPTLIPRSTDRIENLALLPGDLCEVQIFGIPQYDYKVRVDDDGNIVLPLVGKIHVGLQGIGASEQAIAAQLVSAELVKNPQVSLHVLESPNHFATVSGEVKAPGPVTIYGEKRLLDVISAAGGLTPASSPLLTIYRRGSQDPFQLRLSPDAAASAPENITIYPGDNVVISKVGVVYILGAVHTQGAIPLKNTSPLTLIEAMAVAGGVNYEAAMNKAYILRVSSDGRTEIPFDVNAVLKHRAPDQALQSDDIVLIPTSQMKAALKGGAAGIAASLVAGVGYITVR
jgi:polysaccharide export outer membrane protein